MTNLKEKLAPLLTLKSFYYPNLPQSKKVLTLPKSLNFTGPRSRKTL